jgi:hypothetical protein
MLIYSPESGTSLPPKVFLYTSLADPHVVAELSRPTASVRRYVGKSTVYRLRVSFCVFPVLMVVVVIAVDRCGDPRISKAVSREARIIPCGRG